MKGSTSTSDNLPTGWLKSGKKRWEEIKDSEGLKPGGSWSQFGGYVRNVG